MATDTDPLATMLRRIKQLEGEVNALRTKRYGDVRETYGNGIGTFAANHKELPEGWQLIDMEGMEWQASGPGYTIFVAKSRSSREDVIKLAWLVHDSKAQVVSDKQAELAEGQANDKTTLMEAIADVATALGWKDARSKARTGRLVEYHLPSGEDMVSAINELHEQKAALYKEIDSMVHHWD